MQCPCRPMIKAYREPRSSWAIPHSAGNDWAQSKGFPHPAPAPAPAHSVLTCLVCLGCGLQRPWWSNSRQEPRLWRDPGPHPPSDTHTHTHTPPRPLGTPLASHQVSPLSSPHRSGWDARWQHRWCILEAYGRVTGPEAYGRVTECSWSHALA
jgi:hypothetical protein